MATIDKLPLAFRCPACGKVVRTTRGFLLKERLDCPQCGKEVPRNHLQWYAQKCMLDFVKTVKDLEQGAA